MFFFEKAFVKATQKIVKKSLFVNDLKPVYC